MSPGRAMSRRSGRSPPASGCVRHAVTVQEVLEFWPEYDGGPIWSPDGRSADLDLLPLSNDLRERLRAWNARYDDANLPFEQNAVDWLAEGRSLLGEVRAALGEAYEVVVTEPWWREEPDPSGPTAAG